MKRAIGKLLSGIVEAAKRGVVRTPVEVAIGVATAIVFSYVVSTGTHELDKFAVTFGLTAMTTLIAVFATSALYELDVLASGQRWALTGSYLVAGALYGTFVLDVDQIAELWRWGLLTSGLGLAAILTPLAARSQTLDPREMTWRFTLRLGVRTVLTGVYTTLLYIGLVLGLTAFNHMFELHLDDVWFVHLAGWIFVAGSPWMIAAGLADFTDRESPIAERIPELIHRVGVWLVMPLLALYMLILYGYGGRVLVTGEAPSNLLSPLALGAAMLGLVAMFFIEPLRRHGEDGWLAEVFETFPLAYLPLLPMPAWAIWQRIDQYGVTEFRYVRLLAVGGLLVCFGWATWRIVRDDSYSVTGMPAAFAVLFFLASFGPWGALSVAESSQLSRLQSDIASPETESAGSSASAPSDGSAGMKPRPSHRSTTSEAGDRVRYLVDHFGPASLTPVLPENEHDVTSHADACEALDVECGYSSSSTHLSFDSSETIPVPVTGTLHPFDCYGTASSSTVGSVTVSTSGSSVTFELQSGPTYSADLAAHFLPLVEVDDQSYESTTLEPHQATLELSADRGRRAFVHVDRLSLEQSDDRDDWRITNLSGALLVPEN